MNLIPRICDMDNIDNMDIEDSLIPERYPQEDLFLCDVADAVLKDVMPGMEHPFYSLSKKPDLKIRKYEHNGFSIQITPSVLGHATIYDKDILVYAVSQAIAKANRGEEVSQSIHINAHDLLRFTNRGTGGRDYTALEHSLRRLKGTMIETNIPTGDQIQTVMFGLVDTVTIKRQNDMHDGRLESVNIVLSDWVFNAINAKEVLTLHRDYFRLRKPIEKRLYELGRKHCGSKSEWKIGLDLLLKKTGSSSKLRRFRQTVREIVKTNHLPDYTLVLSAEKDQVIFKSRFNRHEEQTTPLVKPVITNTETYEAAKKFITGKESVYDWEADWIKYWEKTGSPKLLNPDKAFLGFCKGRFKLLKEGGQGQLIY